MNSICRAVVGGLLLWSVQAYSSCPAANGPWLSIVIDDLGYQLEWGLAVSKLPAPVTLAIIPGTPHASTLAQAARERGKETMIHMPMAASQTASTDPYALLLGMSAKEFDQVLSQAFSALPQAQGLNNHQGSALTADRDAMASLMTQLKQREMFFIDSRTTEKSVALAVAGELGVPATARNVFLDNERSETRIAEQLQFAINLARQEGHALAIGHPYPETIAALDKLLPEIPIAVTLVPASQLARCQATQIRTSIP